MLQLIEDSAVPVNMVGLLFALPNTQLQRRLAREGRLSDGFQVAPDDAGDQCTGGLNFITTRPRAEILRDKGTNRQQLFRGQVDKYTWVDIGSSYVLSDLLAAFLLAQLEEAAENARRRVERLRPLRDKGALSDSDLDDAEMSECRHYTDRWSESPSC